VVVDDDALARQALRRILEGRGFEVQEAEDGTEALEILHDSVDLVLLDLEMPGMTGIEVLREIRSRERFSGLPVVLVTETNAEEARRKAVEYGANDIISKPFEAAEVGLRAEGQLRLKRAADRLRRHEEEMEADVRSRTAALRKALRREKEAREELHEAQLDTIRRLVLAAELKDSRAAKHVARIGHYCTVLGKGLGMVGEELDAVGPACTLHDIGMIGIPDAILSNPGPLTTEEWAIMQQHTLLGARILNGATAPILRLGSRVALTHHERWDGTGYPLGLAGTEIPRLGRICAVADVFDGLTTDRPYRKAVSDEEALAHIRKGSGKDFDPQVVGVFFENLEEIAAVEETGFDGNALDLDLGEWDPSTL
jgi:putative two-component system response regulator